MYTAREPELAELVIADPPECWRALGFDVDEQGHLDIGGVRVRLGGHGSGITAWSLMRVNAMGAIDGLPTPVPRVLHPPPFKTHPNGATGIDHVVVVTSSLERTAAALARAGIELRRTQDGERGRMGFRRLGPAILEVVQRNDLEADEALLWGLAVVVISIDDIAQRLGDKLDPIKQAKQQGRRIATLRTDVGITAPLAFMSPEPP
ncbi:MAG: glyoxalase [Acidobacteriota bacterium]|nr:glyoxalase [Acidobacteriota bacterium]